MTTWGHYPSRHSFHPPNFEGIVNALVECNISLSGVGTKSYTADPSGYTSNFAGVIKAIEDFNVSVSGIEAGGQTRDFIAGENLTTGEIVYVSGVSVYKASALSGLAPENYSAIGAVNDLSSVTAGNTVTINLDGEALISGAVITADSELVPGEVYYLSKYAGRVTRYATASGSVTNSGTDQHQALVVLGKATTSQNIELEIQPAIILFE